MDAARGCAEQASLQDKTLGCERRGCPRRGYLHAVRWVAATAAQRISGRAGALQFARGATGAVQCVSRTGWTRWERRLSRLRPSTSPGQASRRRENVGREPCSHCACSTVVKLCCYGGRSAAAPCQPNNQPNFGLQEAWKSLSRFFHSLERGGLVFSHAWENGRFVFQPGFARRAALGLPILGKRSLSFARVWKKLRRVAPGR
jgi:hypothetical protein